MKSRYSTALAAPTTGFLQDTIAGLECRPRTLPTKYLYDARGSALFERICDLPEYYLTRTELALMRQYGDEMATHLGSNLNLIELGSGSSVKTRLVLDRLVRPREYVPVDISRAHLYRAAQSLADDYPHINVRPVCADFTKEFVLPKTVRSNARRAVYLPGSTIGNFTRPTARRMLDRIARICGPHGSLLIGIDLRKDVKSIVAAYNDSQGVTAEFNLNLLRRINRELGADFELRRFRHWAPYRMLHHRIEMHLVSTCRQKVRVAEREFEFADGETIRTEFSHKYTVRGFARMASRAGFELERSWTDARRLFAVLFLSTVAGRS